jgi:glycosyltransferase involved in cell wall biosynthesis
MDNKTRNSAKVFIGLPTYNRPETIEKAIESLRAQTYQNWAMVISDNASEKPEVMEIGLKFQEMDPRIRYVRHETSLGAANNFRFLVETCDSPYFMWATDDDIWEPDYIETMVSLLEENESCQMAFGGTDLCHSFDHVSGNHDVYGNYPDPTRFNSSSNRLEDAKRFLADPENWGKAMLFYGLFRAETLKKSTSDFWDEAFATNNISHAFGRDVVFLYGFICLHQVIGTNTILIHKNVQKKIKTTQPEKDKRPKFVPISLYKSYSQRLISLSPGAEFKRMARSQLRKRLLDKYLSKLPW